MSNVGLCLNSSFLGFFAHAGFLAELLALGVRPKAVSGASAGALVAGLYAGGMTPAEMLTIFLSPEIRQVFRERGAVPRGLATMLNLPGHTGALRMHRAVPLLKRAVGDKRIEDCRDPKLGIAVTNLTTGRMEVAAEGSLVEMILASGTAPGFFAARPVDGNLYWDGGIANPLPFDQWIEDPEIDTILLHTVVNPEELAVRKKGRPLRISGAINLSHQIICDELLRLKLEIAERAGKRVVSLRTEAPRPNLWNATKAGAQCVELGRETVNTNRDLLKNLCATAERHSVAV